MVTNNNKRPFFHFGLNAQIAFWVILLIAVTFLSAHVIGFPRAMFRSLLLFLCHAAIFYSFYTFLVPLYFEKKKYVKFTVATIVVFLVVTPLRLSMENNFRNVLEATNPLAVTKYNILWVIIFSQFLVASFSTVLRIAVSSYEAKRKISNLQQAHLETELRFLRSQLNPHFLFNTINNLYALVLEKSDKAPQALLKLSALLRYCIYECVNDKVPLEKELDALKSYSELFTLRFEQTLAVDIQHDNPQGMRIEPMILIPLLENCFKHSGIGQLATAYISVKIKHEKGCVTADFVNSMQPNTTPSGEKEGGIGLNAINKRLQLHYPGQYIFNTYSRDNDFHVHLSIPVECN